MARTSNPLQYLADGDHGQPDAKTEAYYDYLDGAADRGLSAEEAEEEWDRMEADRARRLTGGR